MSNSPMVQKALKEVFEELAALPPEEFMRAIEKADGPITQMYRDFAIERGLLKCSFCAKGQKEVKTMITGPLVVICDECVELCSEVVAEERAKPFYDLRNAP